MKRLTTVEIMTCLITSIFIAGHVISLCANYITFIELGGGWLVIYYLLTLVIFEILFELILIVKNDFDKWGW